MSKIISTKKLPNPIGPYVPAIQIQNFIFLSGQISQGDNTKKNISTQTQEILTNINIILESININVSNIIKTTIFMINLKDINIVNDIYKNFFFKYSNNLPARSCVEVSKLPQYAKIEIEAIAFKHPKS
ncbi:MAG: Rid family detoxifying hydrolase [Buchnera aphidicola (Chaetogeoica yunlongensis)]